MPGYGSDHRGLQHFFRSMSINHSLQNKHCGISPAHFAQRVPLFSASNLFPAFTCGD